LLRQAADWTRAHKPAAPALGADRKLRIRLAGREGARQGRREERPLRHTAPAYVVLTDRTPSSQRRRNETATTGAEPVNPEPHDHIAKAQTADPPRQSQRRDSDAVTRPRLQLRAAIRRTARRGNDSANSRRRPEARHRTDRRTSIDRKWWTLAAVAIAIFMLLLDASIVNVALPDIQRQLHASISDLQWVIDAYALSLAALLLTAGSLADLRGRRVMFATGIAIFTAGSLLCGVAQSPLFLTLARAGQGVGGAAMFATSLALLAQAFRGPDRGIAFGVYGAITGIAVAVGPVLGGVITSGLSWRWIFFVNIPIGAVAIALTLLRVEESRDPMASRPDWLGFVTFSSALGLLVYGLIDSSTHSWGSDRVVVSLVTAALLLAVFLVAELRQRRPMFDLSLLRKPTFVGGLGSAFAISASALSMITFLVLYLQNVLGYSPVGTGLRVLALSGALFVTASVAGRLTAKVPTRLLISPGFVLIGTGLLLMRGISSGSEWTHLLPGLIIVGAGIGLVSTPLASTAVGVVHPARAGMAGGINTTFRQIGLAAGVAALGSIFASQIRHEVASSLAGTPLARSTHQIATAVSSGGVAQMLAHAPRAAREQLAAISSSSFVHALNDILLIAALVAFAGAAVALSLIRQKDYVDPSQDVIANESKTAIAAPATEPAT
jgi:EmrB/QacA subfamily drug resistance transporter